jgi:hypothetical protein
MIAMRDEINLAGALKRGRERSPIASQPTGGGID